MSDTVIPTLVTARGAVVPIMTRPMQLELIRYGMEALLEMPEAVLQRRFAPWITHDYVRMMRDGYPFPDPEHEKYVEWFANYCRLQQAISEKKTDERRWLNPEAEAESS